MKLFQVLGRNYRILGISFILWDIPYQIFRKLNNLFKNVDPLNEEIVKHKVNDYYMYINKNGQGIHRDLFLHGIREPESTKIVKSILEPGDVCLEAGANIGYYALMESKLIGPEGKVFAIEPINDNVSLLEKNVSLNNLYNIEVFNLAVSNKPGKIKINVSADGNLNTPGMMENPLRVEEVKAVSIDSFFKDKKKPNFMRMDIEGFEDVVFRGAKKTLINLETIFVELHFNLISKDKMKKLLKELKYYGFEIDKAVLEWERWEREDRLLGKVVNYFHKKRSWPRVYSDMTIDTLIENEDFMSGHHCLEVFFSKK